MKHIFIAIVFGFVFTVAAAAQMAEPSPEMIPHAAIEREIVLPERVVKALVQQRVRDLTEINQLQRELLAAQKQLLALPHNSAVSSRPKKKRKTINTISRMLDFVDKTLRIIFTVRKM